MQAEPASVPAGWIEAAGQPRRRISVTASRMEPGDTNGFLLVAFEEQAEILAPAAPDAADGSSDVLRLETELRRARDELQSTVAELQANNEETKASNEEITSVNEELQSTNEELETSKEELQSLNEEPTTVNAQLQAKMDELLAATSDLTSLLSSTDIAVIFLDSRFRIRRFTPAVTALIELLPSDVGRPLADLSQKFADPDLLRDAQQVMEKLVPVDKEVLSENGRWFERRALPYRTSDNRIEGVVLTFVDVTERRRIENDLREAEERLAHRSAECGRLRDLLAGRGGTDHGVEPGVAADIRAHCRRRGGTAV